MNILIKRVDIDLLREQKAELTQIQDHIKKGTKTKYPAYHGGILEGIINLLDSMTDQVDGIVWRDSQ